MIYDLRGRVRVAVTGVPRSVVEGLARGTEVGVVGVERRWIFDLTTRVFPLYKCQSDRGRFNIKDYLPRKTHNKRVHSGGDRTSNRVPPKSYTDNSRANTYVGHPKVTG